MAERVRIELIICTLTSRPGSEDSRKSTLFQALYYYLAHFWRIQRVLEDYVLLRASRIFKKSLYNQGTRGQKLYTCSEQAF